MNTIYCKNCENIVGKWNNTFYFYDGYNMCHETISKKNKFINFLDCINCKKFVGLLCHNVCQNCFGKKLIFDDDKKLFNWFLKYKKITNYNHDSFSCKICNTKRYICQYWFFEELTFHK